ncbi:uncharacterized protein G2W53_013228 [Senna tora]|uniref:Uncharacterized protein n=1 Tax=Senna tora TaxID=362788 RepID=A0A834TYI8_9FABA|nr:uncharacterized protein G2W53_013228 [Senna tora]
MEGEKRILGSRKPLSPIALTWIL